MKHLYFARHGLSELNAAGLFAGHTETPLTELGRQQARAAGQTAKTMELDLIVSSPLSRARQTAEIIGQVINLDPSQLLINELFMERNFGALERQPWRPDLDVENTVGIEKLADLLARARQALDWLESLPAYNILIVSHGSFGRALRHHLLPELPFDHPDRLANAQIVQWL